MYIDAPYFSYVLINIHEKYDDMLVRGPLLFVRSDTYVKSIRSREVYRLGDLCFLYATMCM
jgi:hydroxyacyl-ACP dehydratase HTD2-like protein with hotdog domain